LFSAAAAERLGGLAGFFTGWIVAGLPPWIGLRVADAVFRVADFADAPMLDPLAAFVAVVFDEIPFASAIDDGSIQPQAAPLDLDVAANGPVDDGGFIWWFRRLGKSCAAHSQDQSDRQT